MKTDRLHRCMGSRMAKIRIEISFKREGRSGTRIIHIVAGIPAAVRK